jgi:hypothetical protein
VGCRTHEYKSCTKDKVHGSLMCPPFSYSVLRLTKTTCKCILLAKCRIFTKPDGIYCNH